MTVFLCIKKDINRYDCKKFNNFLDANNYFIENYKDVIITSTMISVCKYLPLFIQKYILNNKLKNIFVKSNII